MPRVRDNGIRQIVRASLETGTIVLNSGPPFKRKWQRSRGLKIPIEFTDNLLYVPEYRKLVAEQLEFIAAERGITPGVIVGNTIPGIIYGSSLADRMKVPFTYINPNPKNQREQIPGSNTKNLEEKTILLVEGPILTGKRAEWTINLLNTITTWGGVVRYCLSLFNHGLEEANQRLENLNPKCELLSLLTYQELLRLAEEEGLLN